jgi:hypothetical protein
MPGQIEWHRLFHAYGPATDAPRQLAALRRDGLTELVDSTDGYHTAIPYSYVWSTTYCQGHLTPATPAVAGVLAAEVADPDFDASIRLGVLFYFRELARAVLTDDIAGLRAVAAARGEPTVQAWLERHLASPTPVFRWSAGDAPGRVLLAGARVDVYDLLPTIYATVAAMLDPAWPEPSQVAAASAAALLVRHPGLAQHRDAVLAHHHRLAVTEDPHLRASLVLGLGELGEAPHDRLDDPHIGVRICAALAPPLAADPAALTVLADAAAAPRVFSRCFGTMHLPQLQGDHVRELITVLCERVRDPDRLIDAALASLHLPAVWERDADPSVARAAAEPFLRLAFPDGLPAAGAATAAQRSIAAAATSRDELWDHRARPTPHGPTPGTAWATTLGRLGLPVDRLMWTEAARPPMHPDDAGMRITAINQRSAQRLRPRMYVGLDRGDPDFAAQLVDVALVGLDRAGITGARVEIDADLRFTVDLGPDTTPTMDEGGRPDLAAMAGLRPKPLGPPWTELGMCAAYSEQVSIRARVDGRTYTQSFVDGIAVEPARVVAEDDHAGVRITFTLDADWLPSGARILDLAGAHQWVVDQRD